MASESKIRQNFSPECEQLINDQINMELYASYVYLSMGYYFDKDNVSLPGISKYFIHQSDEEKIHAKKLMDYMNKRGGSIILKDIKAPDTNDWGTALQAFNAALELEKKVNQSLLNIHANATLHEDANLCDFLEAEYLKEQVDDIKKLGGIVTNLKRVGEGLGEYYFDKELE